MDSGTDVSSLEPSNEAPTLVDTQTDALWEVLKQRPQGSCTHTLTLSKPEVANVLP